MARKKDKTLLIGLSVAGLGILAFWKWQTAQQLDAATRALNSNDGTTTLASTTTMPGTAVDTTPPVRSTVTSPSVAQTDQNVSLTNAINAGRLTRTATASVATAPGFGLLR